MFNSIGATEIMVILLVILIFFGAKRIPELARGLGQGMKEFKKASQELQSEFEKAQRGDSDASSNEEPTNSKTSNQKQA
ncbi:Sec-independent protein translocase subunit TatA/TatB [Fodinibius sediminis]|uniref:Sec-independent protein translocase protein TatA n=1 Tax=Fodinibius sediminis TaxID=1214077 RepID=A0A521FFU2_9BACT|nr:twin-arginine translocase TatA/TatE family subunit [Fodinibius sediminis]SMO94410.1 sec-independent protein translocase protein TatA [Fodinibius sediminis]